jgi:outer membrane protein assembly factor BamB
VSQATGEVVWSAPVANGDDSSPAVFGSGVFVSFACNQAYGFERSSGNPLWHYSTNCSGGGGKTVMLSGGRVYTRDSDGNLILNVATGELIGSFEAHFVPAAAANSLYTVADGVLAAQSLGDATPRWMFGDGAIVSAPLVVDNLVIAATNDGLLQALAIEDGAVISSTQLPAAPAGPDEQNVSQPLTGFSAAEDKLFIPCGQQLLAF